MRFTQMISIGFKVLNYHILKKRTPITVSYISTYKCNQKCIYCDCSKNDIAQMDTKSAMEFIRGMKDAGVVKLGFAGGESLTRPDIEQLIRYAHECGLVISLSSNGRLIQKYIDVISECVGVVQLSLDGPEEIHDRQRGSGSYQCVIEAIELLHKYKVKVITNTVITKNNKEHIDFVLKIAEKYKHYALIQPVFAYGLSECEEIIDDMRLGKDEMHELVLYLKECKRKHRPIANSRAFLNYVKKSMEISYEGKCTANDLFCSVNPDGNLLPCCFCSSEIGNQYNVVKMGFEKAFEASKENTFSHNCKGCYCNAYIETNYAFKFNVGACLNAMSII